MSIKSAQYVKILGKDINGSISVKLVDEPNVCVSVPIDPKNTDYAEIMRQVKEEGLTIKDAD